MAEPILKTITIRNLEGKIFTRRYDFQYKPAEQIGSESGSGNADSAGNTPELRWSPDTDPVLEEIVSASTNGEFERAEGLAKEANYTLEIKNVKNEK